MPTNIECPKMLKQNKNHELINNDYSFIGLSDQSESESKWIKLHQMFDR